MSTRPYRPANGTESAIFDDLWCSNCQADAAFRKDHITDAGCEILARTMIYDEDSQNYPPEWVEDDVPLVVRVQDQHTGRWYPESVDTRPRCTAFVPIGDEPTPCKSQTPGAEPGANSLCKSGDGGQEATYVADERQGELGV